MMKKNKNLKSSKTKSKNLKAIRESSKILLVCLTVNSGNLVRVSRRKKVQFVSKPSITTQKIEIDTFGIKYKINPLVYRN